MVHRFLNLTLKSKLILLFVIVAVFPIIFLFITFSTHSTKLTLQNSANNTETLLCQINSNLTSKISTVNSTTLNFIINKQLKNLLIEDEAILGDINRESIISILRSTVISNPSISNMVLYGKNIITKGKCTGHEKVINVCIREDCESEQENIDDFYEKIKQNYNIRKVSTVIKSPVVLRKRIGELQKSWETFANAEITITDRLHAMLFSVLNGTPCIVLNNKTGKVFGVADWLDDTNMIVKANSLSEVLEKLKRTTIWEHKKYDREKLLNYFEKMAEVIRKD